MPALLITAMPGLLLIHTPPEAGIAEEVSPIHNVLSPVSDAAGLILTVIISVESEIQPDNDSIKINLAVPTPIPVAMPPALMVATALLELIQMPPVDGCKVVFEPMHIFLGPVIRAVGLPYTTTDKALTEAQPVADSVKRNWATPCDKPVTNPLLLTDATVG